MWGTRLVTGRGFVKLSTVIAIALGCGFVASVILNIVQNQRANQDHRLLQGEITDLRYQVNEDKQQLASPTPSPSPTASPDATPEPTASPMAEASPTPAPDPGVTTMTVINTGVASSQPNLRAAAKSSSTSLISHVPAGTTATLVDAGLYNNYRHVTINGKTGYLLAAYLQ
ncbi:MAG TPA: hypothetical protein VHQ86_01080 [Candidatus Saccharimonadia bacterium]|jgi:hypothetical protein|nr:hypothetical protein [Candidatus Saccharimonadia bacterium]